MTFKALLLAFALCAFTMPAQAQFVTFDDPALTPGDTTDRIMILTTAQAVSVDSITFDATPPHRKALFFSMIVANCTSCNHQLQFQIQEPNGTWIIHTGFTGVTANGTTRYTLGAPVQALGTFATNITAQDTKPFPARFRVHVARVAGTADVTVSGQSW